jgi:transposase
LTETKDYVLPDLKKENLKVPGRIPQATFGGHLDNSMYHTGSKVASKSQKHHVSRLSYPPYSPDVSPSNFVFGMLKRVLKDRKFNESDEIEEAMTKVRDELTFHEVQSLLHNWTSRLAWVIENGGVYVIE